MFDISNICRICLREEYPKLPIFTEDDGKSESKPTLPEKIMSFARVKVVKDDGLPMYICVKCYCQVDTTVEFKRLCEESFNYFKRELEISSLKAIPPSHQDDKENFEGQHHTLPEDCIKSEECGPQYELTEEVAQEGGTQVFRVTSFNESWVNNYEADFDASLIKCKTSSDLPNIEIDLSNVKIENVSDNWSDEERANGLGINLEDLQDGKTQNFYGSVPTPNTEKTCKCRSCEMVFANRREMGFHISFAHRRCSTCSKYFYSNKDKNQHVCNRVTEPRADKVDRFCYLCNTTVDQIESHTAWHVKNTTKVSDAKKETNTEGVNAVGQSAECDMTGVRIKCSLCDVVCLNERGFKVHLKCIHNSHRIIYPCFKCKSRKFFTKVSCIKHLTKKHGIAATENVKFELEQVSSGANVNGREKRKLKKNRCESKGKIYPKTKCPEQSEDSNLGGKGSEKKKWRKNKIESSPRKCVKQLHPPFSHSSPIIRNNFNVTLDHKSVKRYVCRGCDIVFKGYVAAYNHYYTFSKRKTELTEEDDFVVDGKPFSCKWCKLKFASGGQAMMHRIHAHKYFYKKYGKEKK